MIDKTSNKKRIKEYNNQMRVLVPFNIGTRTHKTAKDYDRKRNKKIIKNFEKGIDN